MENKDKESRLDTNKRFRKNRIQINLIRQWPESRTMTMTNEVSTAKTCNVSEPIKGARFESSEAATFQGSLRISGS